MYKSLLAIVVLVSLAAAAVDVARSEEKTSNTVDKELAADLELLQGSWELLHVDELTRKPTMRSVKTIEGNRETLRRYNLETGELRQESSVEFKLTKSGNVRVFTFYAIGDTPKNGSSYVYKVDKKNFYDVPGLLNGDEYRNYQSVPHVWTWKRIRKMVPFKPEPKTDTKPES